MTARESWNNPRTIERMSDILHPERKKEQGSPFGAIIEALVPNSPKKSRSSKNASNKSKQRVQVRKKRKGLQAKNKGSSPV